MSSLFPPGIDHLLDLPHTFHNALLFALQVISWDKLDKDERPPRNIWLRPKELRLHFKRVDAARRKKYGLDKDEGDIDGDVTENAALGMLVK